MKKIITLCLSALMILSLVACGNKTTVVEKGGEKQREEKEEIVDKNDIVENEPSGEVSEENETPSDMTKSEAVAYNFIKAIQSADYATAMTFLEIDSTYITSEDFGWYVPRSSLGDLVDSTYELKEVSSDGTKPQDNVTLIIGPVTANISTFLNDNNEWKVSFDEAFIKDWVVTLPKGMSLKMNGTEVDKNLLTATDERNDTYTIPYVILKEAELVATSEQFGDFTAKTLPSADEYKIQCEIKDSEPIFEQLRITLNAINEAYENGARDTSEFSDYISDLADTEFPTILANSVDTQYTWNSGSNPTNIRYTRILPRIDDPDLMPCFLYTTNKIGVNIRVEKTWDDDWGGANGNHVLGWVIFEITEDGSVKLAGIKADNNIITARNSMTNDWKD